MDFNKKIFCSLDYYCCVFHETSFHAVLDWLGMDPNIFIDEFLMHQTDIVLGINLSKVFSYEHINISCNLLDYTYGNCNSESVFDTEFHSVRLEITGQGLKFLRALGIDVDTLFRDKDNYPTESFNVTRVDFSFDLVNYKPEFLKELKEYCRANLTPTGCVQLQGRGAPLYCKIDDGCVDAIYFGKSHRILRVYDKRVESSDYRNGLYKKENDYDNPDSWIRIELQLRYDKAYELLFGYVSEDDRLFDTRTFWLCVFRWIFEFYTFAQIEGTTKQNRKPAEFWKDLWDWEEIPTIIQNENSTQYVLYKDVVLKDAQRIISRIQRDLAALYKIGGKATIQKVSDDYFKFLFNYDDVRSCRARDRELSRLNVLLSQGAIDIADSYDDCEFGYFRFHNTVRYKWF